MNVNMKLWLPETYFCTSKFRKILSKLKKIMKFQDFVWLGCKCVSVKSYFKAFLVQ